MDIYYLVSIEEADTSATGIYNLKQEFLRDWDWL